MKAILFTLLCGNSFTCSAADLATKPNIIFILADDMGYGDVHCLNPERCKLATPYMDKLAAQGMTFTAAHSTSAVCSPSRYGVLTGRYNWRSRLQKGIVGCYEKPLIPASRQTVAGLLKEQGYATGCVGKWHLGFDWPKKGGEIDYSQPITGGPTAVGFDYYFGVSVPNWPPYCFIENEHTVGIPSVPLPKKLLGNNLSSMPGLALPGWKLENILPSITDKACEFVATHAKADKPFFMYFALTSPHTPLSPTKEWVGKSGLGKYGDFVMQTDGAVGQVLAAVDKAGIADNTLVILTSDNGCAPYVGVEGLQLKEKGILAQKDHQRYKELEALGHYSSGDFRGHKADIWDGGHRIPFLIRWPAQIKAGSKSDQLVSLVDFMATCADILQVKIPGNAAEDSVSLLPIFKGQATAPVQDAVVLHSVDGAFAIQQENWKLVLCPSSGGWSNPKPGSKEAKVLPSVQLYDMSKDMGEQTNESVKHPEIVERLTKRLEKLVADGRSTPGPKQSNDVTINLWKEKPGPRATSAKDKDD